jgi:DNA mismatch repair protein MutL
LKGSGQKEPWTVQYCSYTLDFERETAFDHIRFDKNKPVQPPVIDVDPEFNPFEVKKSSPAGKNLTTRANPQQWEKLYPERKEAIQSPVIDANIHKVPDIPAQRVISPDWDNEQGRIQTKKFMHLHGRFIISSIKSGVMIIDQQRAHERILFERHLKMLQNKKSSSQTLLFPEQVRLSEHDATLLNEIKEEVAALGFEINEINKNNFIVSAVPAELPDNENIRQVIELILENFRKNQADVKLDNLVNIARSLAKSLSVKHGKILSDEEMNALADDLFSCEMPYQTPSGKPVFTTLSVEELSEKFK